MNTHYGVITFSGDPACEHDDEELRGQGPSLTMIASGSEDFCWHALDRWTEKHPLRMWEEVEVLARDTVLVRFSAKLSALRSKTRQRQTEE